MYQACRWYDPNPNLVFVLQLMYLLPQDKQFWLAERLDQFLSQRVSVPSSALPQPNNFSARWYDQLPLLSDSIAKLKQAPQSVQVQGTQFLMKLIQDMKPVQILSSP